MPEAPKRYLELRMIVIVIIDLTNPDLTDALKADHRQPSSVAHVVAAEVASNLESVSYVETAVVSHF